MKALKNFLFSIRQAINGLHTIALPNGYTTKQIGEGTSELAAVSSLIYMSDINPAERSTLICILHALRDLISKGVPTFIK